MSLFQAGYAKAIERAETIEELKKYDALFISEVNYKTFDPRIMVGTFFDEIMDARADQAKVTIVSFSEAIGETSEIGMECGDYLAELAKTPKTTANVLRFKVGKHDV
jgi:hypothetical protein